MAQNSKSDAAGAQGPGPRPERPSAAHRRETALTDALSILACVIVLLLAVSGARAPEERLRWSELGAAARSALEPERVAQAPRRPTRNPLDIASSRSLLDASDAVPPAVRAGAEDDPPARSAAPSGR